MDFEKLVTDMGAEDVRLTSEGVEARCPFCKSGRRSFRVARVGLRGEVGAFICHKCDARGNLPGLLMKAYGWSFRKAVEYAICAGWARVTKPKDPVEQEPLSRAEIDPYVDNISHYLLRRGYSRDWIRAYMIGMDPLTEELVIPTFDMKGTLVGITRRLCIPGAGYFHSAGFRKSEHLFGTHVDADREWVYVTEGQLDPQGLAPLVEHLVVSLNGSMMSETQARLLWTMTRKVILALDNDTAGRKGTSRAIDALRHTGSGLVEVLCYDGKDPGDLTRGSSLRTVSSFRWRMTAR